MRFLADIPDDDVRWLDAKARELGKSRAAVLREAVAAYRAEAPKDWLEAGFGAWKDRADIGDSVEWQRRERASSTRPWDADYAEVRTEFPDLFDPDDDREHERHKAWLAQFGQRLDEGSAHPSSAAADEGSGGPANNRRGRKPGRRGDG